LGRSWTEGEIRKPVCREHLNEVDQKYVLGSVLKTVRNGLFLTHAMDRIAKWKLAPEMVGETLLGPEEVLIGHHKRFIAHKYYGEHILRAVYEYDNLIPSLVTVYFPYKNRYYEGGKNFENKILE
jgi:hypothetical protein